MCTFFILFRLLKVLASFYNLCRVKSTGEKNKKYHRHITPKKARACEKKYASNPLDEKVGDSACKMSNNFKNELPLSFIEQITPIVYSQ